MSLIIGAGMDKIDSTQVLQAMADAVIVTDSNFNVIYFNEAAVSIYQLKRQDVLGKPVTHHIKYEYPVGDEAEALRQLNESGRWEGEVRVRRKDGKVLHLVSTVNFLRNAAGERTGVIAVNKDISELKQERLLRQEAELTTNIILENSGQALFLLNSDFSILMYNQLSYEIMRSVVKSEITVGKNLIDLLPHHRRPDVRAHLQKALQGKTIRYQVQYGTGDWLEIQFIPVQRPDGNIFEICTSIRDITAQKRRQEQLMHLKIKRQKELTKATLQGQEKERNEIGRELHDNVNQILAAAKLQLSQGINYPQENTDMLERAHSYVQMAIDEVRKLSHQLVAPGFHDELFTEALSELVKPFSLRFKVNLRLGEFDEEKTDQEVKLVLYRVLQEQLNNIYRHAAATEVHIELKNGDEGTSLSISDNGKGFDRATTKPGVGLTNIHNRVVSVNGKAKLHTAPQKGCRIFIEIPAMNRSLS